MTGIGDCCRTQTARQREESAGQQQQQCMYVCTECMHVCMEVRTSSVVLAGGKGRVE